jgi:GDSL-like lipase/acylhydrolase family protein
MSWTKKLLFFAIGIGVPSLAGLLLLELVFGSWIKEDPWKRTTHLNIIRDRQITYAVDELYESDVPRVVYTRDKYGLRGSCADPKEIDILTVGGSTTDQRYIADGKTYQDVLQSHLQHKLQRTVCVSNAGVDGHSTFGHISSFQVWFPLIPDLKPQFVLLYVGINDADFRLTSTFDTSDESAWTMAIRKHSAFFRLCRAIKDIVSGIGIYRAYAEHGTLPSADDYRAESTSEGIDVLVKQNTAAFAQRLAIILTHVKQMGARPICATPPHLFVSTTNGVLKGTLKAFEYGGRVFNGLDYHKSILMLNEVMQKQCQDSGGFYIDIWAKKFDDGDFYDVVHMTPVGAAKLGTYFFDAMIEQGIVASLK